MYIYIYTETDRQSEKERERVSTSGVIAKMLDNGLKVSNFECTHAITFTLGVIPLEND